MKNRDIRCALISLSPFPIGDVCTVRYSSYLKAMAKDGCFVKVLILAPSRTAALNKKKSGILDGINYQYMSEITWRKKPDFFVKGFYFLLGLIRTVKYIIKDKINCIILYENSIFVCLFYRIITKILSVALITDKSEYPFGYNRMSRFKKKIIRLKLKMFDGFIIMTKELVRFYDGVKSKKAKIFFLPMTIDPDKFNNIEKEDVEKPYIAVMFGTHNRDGLYESLVAYNRYCKLSNGHTLDLMFIGNLDKLPVKDKIVNYIKKENLSEHVIIKGVVPTIEIPRILSHAECLLTTPNEYSSGGFPTKLGEYLLSSVPVVATDAGEISQYLTNGKELFLLQPGDAAGIAEKILYIQNNPLVAKEMANRGKMFCTEVFNADTYVDELISFMKGILPQKTIG